MEPDAGWISRDDLLAELEAHGCHLTIHQLHRWRHELLLPSPRRIGLGRGRGTRSFYPILALPQAASLALLLDQGFNLDDAGWGLWCVGYPVTEFARTLLMRDLEEQVENLVEAWEQKGARATDSFITRAMGSNPPPEIELLRSPKGPLEVESLEAVLELTTRVFLGRTTETTSDDHVWDWAGDAVEALLVSGGAERREASRDLEPQKLQQASELFARELNLPRVRAALTAIPDWQLEVYRNEAQYRFELVVSPLGIEPPVIPRPLFWMYFAARYVSPTFSSEVEKGIQELGWTAPPNSHLQRRLAVIQSEAGGQAGSKKGHTIRRKK